MKLVGCAAITLAASAPSLGTHTATSRATWSLHYYTLRGASIDFLMNHPDVFQKVVGGPTVVLKNDTWSRLAGLMKRFSIRYDSDPDTMRSFTGNQPREQYIRDSSFTGSPFFAGDTYERAGFMPSKSVRVKDLREILRADSNWRMTTDGVDLNRRDGQVIFWRQSTAGSLLPASPRDPGQAKIIALMNAIAGDRPPFGYFLQYHTVDLGGCGTFDFESGAFPRYLNLNVAVLENNSGNVVSVGNFRGADNLSQSVRTAHADSARLASGSGPLQWGGPVTLNPGERLVIPVRLALSYSDYAYASPMVPELRTIGRRPLTGLLSNFLRDVKKAGKGFVFNFGEDPDHAEKIQMTDAVLHTFANRPWRNPIVSEDFIFGPSYKISTFNVNSGAANRPSGKTQSIDYTTAGGFGSCPFLYVWDATRNMWLDWGRILVNRVGLAAEATETVPFQVAPSRIAIREREPEETHLADVWLDFTDADGRSIRVKPSGASAQGTIGEDQEREITFDIPAKLRNSPARLRVSGYYIRKPGIEIVPRKSAVR
jgi:hypothetical protein